MTLIWNQNGVLEGDRWTDGEGGSTYLSLDQALETADSGANEIGVLIEPADDVARLAPILDRIAIVAVNFPAFNDGRAFSHASLLRERLGYTGEIRAVGQVLLDQVPFMLRVGIDSVVTDHEPTARRLTEMRLPGIALHYQPAASQARDGEGYSWRRRAAR